jgi:ATPase subunit of ABC transporter with duplicated ATPase domains
MKYHDININYTRFSKEMKELRLTNPGKYNATICKKKYHTNEEWRQKKLLKMKEYRERKREEKKIQKEKEGYNTDEEESRQKKLLKMKEYREKKREEKKIQKEKEAEIIRLFSHIPLPVLKSVPSLLQSAPSLE